MDMRQFGPLPVSGRLAGVDLPPVAHEPLAAVLVVDLVRREVTFANDLARDLVPGRALPMSVDDWSAEAGLEDVSGADLPDGEHIEARPGRPAESLLRVAQGEPITGEAVTAARATSASGAREVLWVVGLPMLGAPDPISSLALVVFLPARSVELVAGVQRTATSLRDRAVLATRLSFTITDPHQPDNPLVWVNPAFTATTGYSAEEVVGRNCRFLQGADTDQAAVAAIGEALQAEQPITVTLRNYRKDGTAFWNELSISPIRDHAGVTTHFVGVQADVSNRVDAQRNREDAHDQVAHAAERLRRLADFTSRMALSRAPAEVVDLLTDMLVPRSATLGLAVLFDEHGHLARPVARHVRAGEPAVDDALVDLADRLVDELVADGPIARVLTGAEGFRVVEELQTGAGEPSAGVRELLTDQLGIAQMIVLPLQARHGVLGAVVVGLDGGRPALDDDELAYVRDLCARAGLMLENTQLYARQEQAAATLQRSLLPRLPPVPGMQVAARYVPSADEAAVGGDWYDVFPLRTGGLGVVVGDVMGHNYASAARMGKLSTIVRAYAYPGSEPAVVLTAVDELLSGSDGTLDILATCLLGCIELTEGGATLRYSSAGHPPALLRWPDGSVEALVSGRGPMVGVAALMARPATRAEDVVELPAGSMLICYTDGLLDAYSEGGDVDAGQTELARLIAAMPVDSPPDAVVKALTATATSTQDDVAIVALRIA